MPDIPFTQFLRPDGKRVGMTIDVDDETAAKAHAILAKPGFEFTIEEMMSGSVAMYITDNDNEEDVACEIVPNGPKVPETVKKMIMEYKLDAS